MDTIVPVTLPKVAKFMEALTSRGVGDNELQATLDNVVVLNQIAALMVPPIDIGLDLSGEFDKTAMERLVTHVFKDYVRHQQSINRDAELYPGKYTWIQGYMPEDLVDTRIMKELLEGLSDRHVAVAVLRSGLVDGREVTVNEVVKRLGLKSAKQVSHLRAQANAHIKARARELYRFGRWARAIQPERPVRRGQLAPDSPVEDMGLSFRAYNILKREGIPTVADLTARTRDDLMNLRNFGLRCVDEVELMLNSSGLHLRQD